MSTTDLVLVIGVVTTSIVTVINAWSQSRQAQVLNAKADKAVSVAADVAAHAKSAARQVATVVDNRSDKQDRKLDHITELTNSTLSAALKRIEELERIIAKMVQDEEQS